MRCRWCDIVLAQLNSKATYRFLSLCRNCLCIGEFNPKDLIPRNELSKRRRGNTW